METRKHIQVYSTTNPNVTHAHTYYTQVAEKWSIHLIKFQCIFNPKISMHMHEQYLLSNTI